MKIYKIMIWGVGKEYNQSICEYNDYDIVDMLLSGKPNHTRNQETVRL